MFQPHSAIEAWGLRQSHVPSVFTPKQVNVRKKNGPALSSREAGQQEVERGEVSAETQGLWAHPAGVPVLPPPVTLSRILSNHLASLSVPWFPNMKKWDDKSPYLTGLL